MLNQVLITYKCLPFTLELAVNMHNARYVEYPGFIFLYHLQEQTSLGFHTIPVCACYKSKVSDCDYKYFHFEKEITIPTHDTPAIYLIVLDLLLTGLTATIHACGSFNRDPLFSGHKK